MKNWPPSPLLFLALPLSPPPLPCSPISKRCPSHSPYGEKGNSPVFIVEKLRLMCAIHIFSKKIKIKIKSLMFVKNSPLCGRLFASPAEEEGREERYWQMASLFLLLLLLFLLLLLPPAHTQLLYIQPPSIQPRGFHDRKRALSSLFSLLKLAFPQGGSPHFPPFPFHGTLAYTHGDIPYILSLLFFFFVKCKHALFFPFCVSSDMCAGVSS